MTDDVQLSHLVHVLGNAFVAASLGLSRDELQTAMYDHDSTRALGSGRAKAGMVLGTVADQVDAERDTPLSMRLSRIAEVLIKWRPEHGTTLAVFTRDLAGAPRPEIETHDPVSQPLCEIARDIAPVFALWEADTGGLQDVEVELGMERHGIGEGTIKGHPSYGRVMAALAADPQLSKLQGQPAADHPGYDDRTRAVLAEDPQLSKLLEQSAPHLKLTFDGQLLRVDPSGLPCLGTSLHTALPIPHDDGLVAGLIHGAYDEVRVAGDSGPEALLRALPDHLDRLRAALDGKPYRAHVLAGIGNLKLPSDSEIATPWGTLRPYRQADADFVPASGPLGCVLQFELDTKLKLRTDGLPSTDGTLQRETDARARMVGLAVLLAQTDAAETTIGTFRSWIASPCPILPPTFVWPPAREDRFWAPTGEELERFRLAIETVRDVHQPSADIAVTRCLRALAERDDPVDAMIDAIIVWENLFGSGTELSFRISSALAVLLGSDPQKRIALQKEFKALYNTRSEVVHGAPVAAKKLTRERSDRAVAVAVAALRKVYTERPDLLMLEPSDRSVHLLFQSGSDVGSAT